MLHLNCMEDHAEFTHPQASIEGTKHPDRLLNQTLDSSAERSKQPSSVEEKDQLKAVRRRLQQHQVREETGLPPRILEPISTSKQNPLEKAKSALIKTLDNTQLLSIMVFQLGGIHPWRVNGRWAWVVEPWADIKSDSRQSQDFHPENIYESYFLELKKRGVGIIDKKHFPNGRLPSLRFSGLGGLQYLDHHRIYGAKMAGMRIVINPSREQTFN